MSNLQQDPEAAQASQAWRDLGRALGRHTPAKLGEARRIGKLMRSLAKTKRQK